MNSHNSSMFACNGNEFYTIPACVHFKSKASEILAYKKHRNQHPKKINISKISMKGYKNNYAFY